MKRRSTFAVFGAGRQGLAAVYDLARFCDASRVFVIEPDESRAQAASERLSRILEVERPRAAGLVSFASGIDDADLGGVDVVVSCAPHAANLALTRRALALGVPFCDLGGNPGVVARQERLARGSRVSVVPECGVSPGLSNIFAVHLARLGCTEIHVRCGGIPLRRPPLKSNPLGYRIVFSASGLLSEYAGRVPVIREARVRTVPALSVIETSADSRGVVPRGLEAAPTSNNAPHVARFLLSRGVRTYDYMTLRYPGHWTRARAWKGRGLLSGDAARDRALAARLEADPRLRFRPGRDLDRLILTVVGSPPGAPGLSRRHEIVLDVAADRRTGFSAMELTTSWGITIVAHALARGAARPRGFATPERFMDGAFVTSEVRRRLEAFAR